MLRNKDSYKEEFMKYLGKAEGLILHKNDGEDDYTAPFGIYRKYNKDTELIKYIDRLLLKFNLNPNSKEDRDTFNNIMKEDTAIKNRVNYLAWEVVKIKYFIDGLTNRLSDKASLTFLSITILSGVKRAKKALQSALGVGIDGIVGKRTLAKLINLPEGTVINNAMIDYTRNFLHNLVAMDEDKYGRFKNGWDNRLNKLV